MSTITGSITRSPRRSANVITNARQVGDNMRHPPHSDRAVRAWNLNKLRELAQELPDCCERHHHLTVGSDDCLAVLPTDGDRLVAGCEELQPSLR
jgi:hypothetical protein